MYIHYKVCTGCSKDKPVSEFWKDNTTHSSDGFQSRCKECSFEASQRWIAEHPERYKYLEKRWYAAYEPKMVIYHKQYYQEHRDEQKARSLKYYSEHRDEQKARRLKYYYEHERRVKR